jgi:hypothetical protein
MFDSTKKVFYLEKISIFRYVGIWFELMAVRHFTSVTRAKVKLAIKKYSCFSRKKKTK